MEHPTVCTTFQSRWHFITTIGVFMSFSQLPRMIPGGSWVMGAFSRRFVNFVCSMQLLAGLPSLHGAPQPFLDEQFLHKNLRASSRGEANWFKVRSSTAVTVTAIEERGTGRVVGRLRIAPQGFAPGVVGTFSTTEAPERRVRLEHNGDQVTLLLDFRFLKESGTNTEIRVGLYNSANSPVTQDGATNSNTHFGYRFDLPQSGGYGLLMKESGGNGGLATGDDQQPVGGGLIKSLPALGSETHKLTLKLLKQSEGIMLTAAVDGQIVQNGVDGSPVSKKQKSSSIYTSFDEVFIGIKNQASTGADFGNVRIEWVPAPRFSLVVAYTFAGITGVLLLWALAVYLSRLQRATPTIRATDRSKAAVRPPLEAPPSRTFFGNRTVKEIKIECPNSFCLQRIMVNLDQLRDTVACPTCGTEIPVAHLKQPSGRRVTAWQNDRRITIPISPRLVPALRGALLLTVPGLAVGAIYLAVTRTYNEPAHFSELLREISSVGEIRKAPAADQGSQHVWYAKNLERGIGLFQIDGAGLSERQLLHLDVDAYEALHLHLHGCSPDSQYFLLSSKQSMTKPLQTLTLMSASTGERLGRLSVKGPTPNVIWLSTNSYVVLDVLGELFLAEISKEGTADGKPVQTWKSVKNFIKRDASSPIALVSERRLAYVNAGGIYFFDVDSRVSKLIGQFSPSASVVSMSYSRDNDCLLLTASTNPVANAKNHLFRSSRGNSGTFSWSQVGPTNEHIYNGQWVLNGQGFAYVVNRRGGSQLVVEDSKQKYSTNLFEGGHVRAFRVSPESETIHAVASLGMEPERIWEYSIRSGSLRSLTAPVEAEFKHAQVIQPLNSTAADGSGGVVPYYLLPPVNFTPKRRYPIVIDGPSERRWSSQGQLLANLGVYYLSVNRSGLKSSEELSGAAADIVTVYREIIQHPNVDPEKVFIMGFSAAGDTVRQLVEVHPEYWQGAIFNNFSQGMHFPTGGSRFPRLLYSIGQLESGSREVTDYAGKACERNLDVVTYLHPGGGHVFGSTALIEERNRLIARFVLRDYWF